MNKEEKQWVETVIQRNYSLKKMQELLKSSNYPEEKIKEFSEYYNNFIVPKSPILTYPQELTKTKERPSIFSIFKSKIMKAIIIIFVILPIYFYLLTISESLTGIIIGISIGILIIFGTYKLIQKKMYNEMEVIQHVQYPTEDRGESPRESEDSGTGRRIRESEEREPNTRSNRELKGYSKLQMESNSKTGKARSSNRKPDRSPGTEHKEVGEAAKSNSSTIPSVEPLNEE